MGLSICHVTLDHVVAATTFDHVVATMNLDTTVATMDLDNTVVSMVLDTTVVTVTLLVDLFTSSPVKRSKEHVYSFGELKREYLCNLLRIRTT
jgi:hypothetical protein